MSGREKSVVSLDNPISTASSVRTALLPLLGARSNQWSKRHSAFDANVVIDLSASTQASMPPAPPKTINAC